MDGGNGVNTPVKDVEGITKELSQLGNKVSSINSELAKTNQSTEKSKSEINSRIDNLSSKIDVIQKRVHTNSPDYSGDMEYMTSEKDNQIIEVEDSELENESKYSAELDEIFTQLHEADYCIAETRQNTVRLGIETRSILDDLRKQLG